MRELSDPQRLLNDGELLRSLWAETRGDLAEQQQPYRTLLALKERLESHVSVNDALLIQLADAPSITGGEFVYLCETYLRLHPEICQHLSPDALLVFRTIRLHMLYNFFSPLYCIFVSTAIGGRNYSTHTQDAK